MGDDLLSQIRLNGAAPRHVAIIMDGNGRWARERNLPRPFGHRAGMKAVREVVEGAIEAGVEVLTLFAFSDENWQRPPTEISALMSLLEEYIAKEADELRQQGVVVHVLGERARLAPGASRARSPSTCTTTPCWRSSSASLAMYSSSRLISAEISVGGRCQFSSENANSVSTSTPASIAPSTTSRTAFMPARCPKGRGRLRSRAQRPLPSMMMATWRGTGPLKRICPSRSSVT